MSFTGLIDSHLHIQDFGPGVDIEAMLDQANAAGVSHLVCNGLCEDDWQSIADIARLYPQVIPCYGLHPWFAEKKSNDWASILECYISSSCSGIGETGLDKCKDKSSIAAQEEVFRIHIALARKYKRPLMIHCVKAWGLLTDILRSESEFPQGFLLHSYSGSADLIKQLADKGAYFSFSGKILYDNYERSRTALAAVPPDRLLLETDAPNMLPPKQFRTYSAFSCDGTEYNHPANLPMILNGLADLLSISPQSLRTQIWENSIRFFEPVMNHKVDEW